MNVVGMIENFIIFTITDMYNQNKYDFVGTDRNRNQVVCAQYNRKDESFSRKVIAGGFDNIQNIVACKFQGMDTALLVISEAQQKFKNTLIFKNGKQKNLPITTSPPIIIKDYESPTTSFLFPINDKVFRIKITDDDSFDSIEEKILENDETLHPQHNGSFINIGGDMTASLALKVVKNNGKCFLKVFNTTQEGFLKMFDLEIDKNTGPFLFYDIKQRGLNDMVFVSRVDNDYFLNIYFNTYKRVVTRKTNFISDFGIVDNSKPPYTADNPENIRINFNMINQRFIPVFEPSKESCLSSGIAITSIDMDIGKNIFLVVRDKDANTNTIICLKYSKESTNKIVEFCEVSYLQSFKNVFSVSFADYRFNGREHILVNFYDKEPRLQIIENDLNREKYGLYLRSLLYEPNIKYGMGLPGDTDILTYGEEDYVALSTQYIVSSFVYPKHSTSIIGIGSNVFVINKLIVRCTDFGDKSVPYIISSIIIPNTYLIIYMKNNGDYSVELYFVDIKSNYMVFMVAILVICTNLVFVAILYFRDKKKEKILNRNDNMHPIFRVL